MEVEKFVNDLNIIRERKLQVEFAVSFILESKKKNSITNTMSTKEIISEYA